MLGWLYKRKEKPVRLTEFDHIMAFAQALARNNPVALIDLVRFLLHPLQSEFVDSADKVSHRRCGIELVLVYAVSPRLFRSSMELNEPRDILMRFSLYQRMYQSTT